MARRNYYRRRRSFGSTRTPTKRASSRTESYVIRELFKLGSAELNKVVELYGSLYGDSAKKYFEKTFSKWKNGEISPAAQTKTRFLHCVPKFLPPVKLFEILGFYVEQYHKQMLETFLPNRVHPGDLANVFNSAKLDFESSELTLDWFVEGVFSREELDSFRDVARYATVERLHYFFQSVRFDLNRLLPELNQLDCVVEISYGVTEARMSVDLASPVPQLPTKAFQMPNVPALIEKNYAHYAKLLVGQNVSNNIVAVEQSARGAAALKDFKLLQGVNMKSFEGGLSNSEFLIRAAAGEFKGRITRKNIPELRKKLFLKYLYGLTFVLGCGLFTQFEFSRGLAFFALLIGILINLFVLTDSHQEIKKYEQSKFRRFTETQS